jgi:hypothetical protein
MGAGTVHHVAWRAREDAEQRVWREQRRQWNTFTRAVAALLSQ